MSRRLVTVLFLDLVGWTGLAERVDPEPLQQLLERYYEICWGVVEEHAGVVEKFIGDAVMAVFGADASREDDAQRALRAAARIRAEVRGLRPPAGGEPLEVHCGLAAGEALVTHSERAGIRVVGDVVNLAARLQSAAHAGETLVNETLAQLAGPRYVLAPLPPVTLKGKADPVPVLRVLGETEGGAERSPDAAPLVDRHAERGLLLEAYREVVREGRSRSVAVLGPAGIGKTRLVRETVLRLVSASADGEPAAAFGTCASYGSSGPHAALADVLDCLARWLRPGPDARAAAVLDGLRGRGPRPAIEELSWAARSLLASAASRPVVVVWDALEYASPSLLTLISELIEGLRHLPVLTVCLGRPDVCDAAEPSPFAGADAVIDLGALAPEDGARLALALTGATAEERAEVRAHELGVDVADRVAAYGGGNPLYIRLMVEWLDAGGAPDDVPPTITAMVGAMIDRLPEPLARLLGAASVIGPTFTVDQLVLLGESAPGAAVAELVGRRLVRATGQAGGPEGEYGFVQQPVHEVAYSRLNKEIRAAGHRRLAEHGVNPAFHYEAALRLLSDLRPGDAGLSGLAGLAAAALLDEGTAALRQRDLPTTTGLLERAVAAAHGSTGAAREIAAVRLSDALMLSGETARALDVVSGAEEDTSALCLAQRSLLRVRRGGVAEADVEQLRAELEAMGADRSAWCRFEQISMLVHLERGRYGAAEARVCAALEHAEAVGDAYETDRLLVALCEVRQWSPTPVAAKLAGCAELLERFAADRFLLLPAFATRARCLALTGDAAGAREALAEAGSIVEQLRLTMGSVLVDQVAGLALSLDGDHAEAERRFTTAADALDAVGYTPDALTLRVQAARECLHGGRLDEAATRIEGLRDRVGEMDLRGRILCTAAAIRLSAEHGRVPAELEHLPSLLARSDDPCLRGEACFDLARALRSLGDEAAARAQAEAAAEHYAAVGASKPLEAVRAWI